MIRQGIGYPLTLKNGGLQLKSDADLVQDAIFSILQTQPYERVMRPRYGIPDQLFDAIGDFQVVVGLYERSLRQQINYPNVTFELSGEFDDGGLGTIRVVWALDGLPQPDLLIPLEPDLRVATSRLNLIQEKQPEALLDNDYRPYRDENYEPLLEAV